MLTKMPRIQQMFVTSFSERNFSASLIFLSHSSIAEAVFEEEGPWTELLAKEEAPTPEAAAWREEEEELFFTVEGPAKDEESLGLDCSAALFTNDLPLAKFNEDFPFTEFIVELSLSEDAGLLVSIFFLATSTGFFAGLGIYIRNEWKDNWKK